MVAHGASRLERAIDAVMRYSARAEREPREVFLAAHTELRDLLEPLLEEAEATPPAAQPERLGEFTLLRELGRGGMGVVFEALQASVDRRVALKVLRPHLTHSPAAVARFKREATLVARLQHPNIVDLYAVGADGDTHYFAMQLVEGVSLQRVLARLRVDGQPPHSAAALRDVIEQHVLELFGLPAAGAGASTAHWRARSYVEAIVRIVADVADALQHAHETQVVHRDVKPANILVQRDGHALVTDFGIARDELSSQLTVTGEFAGTPWYAAPEQIASREAADARGDVFSLGATLYEALTLRRPFEGENAVQVAEAVLRRDPPSPRAHVPEISVDLAAVVLKALEKEPRRRYQSAGEFAADLRACLDGRAVSAHALSLLQRSWRWARRNRALAALAVALFLTLTVTASWIAVQNVGLSRALGNVRRLEDLSLVDRFRKDHNHLPAAHPDDIPQLEEWLAKAKKVVDNIPLHEQRLRELRALALPYAEEERQRDRDTHPKRQQLVELRSRTDDMEKRLAVNERDGVDVDDHPIMRRWIATAREREKVLLAQIEERRSFSFAASHDDWEHGLLSTLVDRCAEFVHPDSGTYTRAQKWLEHMRTVRRRSIEDPAEIWRATIDEIADPARCPQYGGLRLTPQLGLVPLGRDPDSGLHEFAHLQSGRVPVRNAEGKLVLDSESGMVFVLLPGGRFKMGGTPPGNQGPDTENLDPDCRPDEQPEHVVELAPFFLAKFEMTQGQWFRCTGQRPSRYTEQNFMMFANPTWLHPVETVSWINCSEVMRALRLALPTEAQWEYAARGGNHTVYGYCDKAIDLRGALNGLDRAAANRYQVDPDTGWGIDYYDGFAIIAPVGRFRPNPFGLYDILGNLIEWCADRYGLYPDNLRAGDGLRTSPSGHGRILRGGDYVSLSAEVRVARRLALEDGTASSEIGLRPARAVDR